MKKKEMIKRYAPKNAHDDFQEQWLGLKNLEAFMNLVTSVRQDDVWARKQIASAGGRLVEAGCGPARFVLQSVPPTQEHLRIKGIPRNSVGVEKFFTPHTLHPLH
jgi:hypothetical protein